MLTSQVVAAPDTGTVDWNSRSLDCTGLSLSFVDRRLVVDTDKRLDPGTAAGRCCIPSCSMGRR